MNKARTPKPATLRKYGLTEKEWLAILKSQGGGCAVCGKVPKSLRLCTDHEHVYGWKKMTGPERKKYVRGILCYFCNHWYVGRAITVRKARNVYNYLVRYANRRANGN